MARTTSPADETHRFDTPTRLWEGWPIIVGTTVLRRPRSSTGSLNLPRHVNAALDWIKEAHRASTDGGIPAYFDLLRGRWRPSYPETTGYLIPTLYSCAERFGQAELVELADNLARYLLKVRTPEGGVAHWDRRGSQSLSPVVFDTGQVIFGWLAAWQHVGASEYVDAACTAADWLVHVQDSSGAWRANQHAGTVKTIDTRVAWALAELGLATQRRAYVDAAHANLRWALGQQQPCGWFRRAAFHDGRDPFTHNIAYTAEGLLRCGELLSEPRYTAAGKLAADAMLAVQRPDGALASSYGPTWATTARSTCLPGNCQAALLWLRLYTQTGNSRYVEAATRAIAYVASTQQLDTSHPGVRGGVGGSYPIYAAYERMKYPNWATKFFLDALLGLDAVKAGQPLPQSAG